MIINVLKILIIQCNFYSDIQFIPLPWPEFHYQHDTNPNIDG